MWDNTKDIDNNDEIRINLFRLLGQMWKRLKRRAVFYIALVLLVGAACFMWAKYTYTPNYAATSAFTVNRNSNAKYTTGYDKNNVIYKFSKMVPQIIMSDGMKYRIMDDLGYSNSPDFNVRISATEEESVNVVNMTVNASDPQLAYDTIQSIYRVFPGFIAPALGELDLEVISESGVPTRPTNSSPARKAAMTGIFVILILILICLAVECVIDRTAENANDVTRILGMEFLGTLPRAKSGLFGIGAHGGSAQSANIDAEGASTELVGSVRTIRRRIEREAEENGVKTILITSALSSEGKTTAAANLAISLANHGSKVLLVDGNLRNPSVLVALGMPQAAPEAGKGLADVLAGSCRPEAAMVSYDKNSNLKVIPGAPSSAGAVPSTLWSSPAAEQLFRNLREQFDYIVIDAPASASIADSALIAHHCDGYVYVVRENRADASALRKGAAAVTDAGCRELGSILNSI